MRVFLLFIRGFGSTASEMCLVGEYISTYMNIQRPFQRKLETNTTIRDWQQGNKEMIG